MKQVLQFFAWATIIATGLAWFWPAIMAWIGYPVHPSMVNLIFAGTLMLINLVIDGAIFWLYGGPTAIRKFREVLRKNNV